MRYLRGTFDLGLLYKRGENNEFIAYTDIDFVGDYDDRRSTSGYVFIVGSRVVCWCSKKQLVVTWSTTEAEFIAAAIRACHTIWLIEEI